MKSKKGNLKRLIPQGILLVAVAAVLTVVLVRLTQGISSLGWFALNRTVNDVGTQIQVHSIEADAEYIAYLYDIKATDPAHQVRYTGDGYTGEGIAAAPTIRNLDMQFHDTIFRDRNRYTPALVRIRLTNINARYLGGGTVTLTLSRDLSKPESEVTNPGEANERIVMTEFFTSIMRFTVAQDRTWYNSNANTLYSNVDTALYNKIVTTQDYTPAGSSAVFTTVTKSGRTITDISKTDTITLTTAYTSADIIDGHLDIYLYITYDESLVSDFQQAQGIDTSSETVGKITHMWADLESLYVSLGN